MQPNEEYIKMYRQAEKANKDFLKKEVVKHLVANCPKCDKCAYTAMGRMFGD